jgi:hypothetical protein
MKSPRTDAPGDKAARAERLLKIGLPAIPSDLPNVTLRGKQVRITRETHAKNYFDVKVTSVDHLKHLVGNIDRSLETNDLRNFMPHPMDQSEVPDAGLENITKLSSIEQNAVHKAARNIIYGHSHALKLSRSQFAGVSNWILKWGRLIPVFWCNELTVPSGTMVVFGDAAVLYFNLITVHGTGSIVLENPTKVFSTDIQVVP